MVVVGGESGQGLVNDTQVTQNLAYFLTWRWMMDHFIFFSQILNLDRLTWAAASPKLYLSPSELPLKIPTCKGHCLVSMKKNQVLGILVIEIYLFHAMLKKKSGFLGK